MGNKSLSPGTAIATFVNGRYPNRPHGNHAAFYLGQDAGGIYVVDQGVAGGWRPYIAAPLYLHSVAISDGPPERLGQLKGTICTGLTLKGSGCKAVTAC